MGEERDIATILQDYIPRADYEAALEAVDTAVRERDEYLAAADKHSGRLGELEKKLRGRTYRDKFKELAKGKVKDSLTDDVYDLLKLQEDSDEPDEKAISKQLEAFLEKKTDYRHAGEKSAEKPREISRGEGSTRGRSAPPGEPEFRVTRKERGDAVWMRENGARFHQAVKDGTLVMDDD